METWLDQVNKILDYASVLYKDLFPEDMEGGVKINTLIKNEKNRRKYHRRKDSRE
jgi:hypothetical protein